jgi:hypothetical protein
MSRVHAILEVVSGQTAGRLYRCDHSRETTFGRTDAAVVCLPEDFYLSRVHFSVRYDREADRWFARDMKSRHGTFLNDERISNAPLSLGDRLKAGRSEFLVRTLGSDDGNATIRTAAAGVALFAAVAASARSPEEAPKYQRAKCASDLVSLTGTESVPPPASIAWLLSRQVPLFLLVDFSKSSLPRPSQLEEVDYLFNWMDDQVLPFCSPLLLGPADPIDPYEVIDELWGQATLVCLFSELKKPELLIKLRAAIRGDDGTSTKPPKGMFGYCWPEAARAVLAAAPEKLTSPMMRSAVAVLLEAEPPDCWQLFCKTDDESRIRTGLEI